ncbi:MAG TPA: hypothetical protein VN822_10475 [Candidatus Acidoferrales bacterium]|nr:hypothetical protein [Candidatus Acidoferrales bacterium]HYW46409.1 hypothetical protein [Bryobacteraceae bacterium]
MVNKLIETVAWLIGGLIALSYLPGLMGAIVRSVGIFQLLVVLGILCVVAYLRHESRPPAAGRRRGGSGAERTPLLPKGDD